MSSSLRHAMLALAASLLLVSAAQAQQRPYIGFVYPAGGQQGSTFQITLGGQYLEGVNKVYISGEGAKGRLVEYNKHLNPQEVMLLREQLDELKKGSSGKDDETKKLIANLEKRIAEYVLRPASVSISNVAIVEITMAANAKPGERELRLGTPRGFSNPLVFNVGQLPEYTAKPLPTSPEQVLGKEELSIRRRAKDEVAQIKVPSIVNGQVFSGSTDRYRFEAKKGQQIVISCQARQLVPYIADAVPGWFQPVLALYDSTGKEVAYDDDYRFKPDPVLCYEIPKDGEYAFAIYDAIYRGREDFVYRITIGELPFVTSIFPLGGRVNAPVTVAMKGYNLPETKLSPPTKDAEPGIYPIAVRKGGFVSNRVLFALDTLPEAFETEPNNSAASPQKLRLPVIMNGRIDKPGDSDVFCFEGNAGDEIVAEVYARRLDTPLDSVLKLTDASGKQLAANDDRDDVGSGVNTHHADSYLRFTLPANGAYYVHLSDTQHAGGEEYAYRLRISGARPDFELRVVPSSAGLRSSSSSSITVYAIRKDGFDGDIKLGLRDAPSGFSCFGGTLSGTQEVTQVTISTSLDTIEEPVSLSIEGRAPIFGREVAREAVPAEDRMQAFLWRHLVPAKEFLISVFDPSEVPAPRRGKRGKGSK
ncbi:MAG: PPC domain-containing protein [Verrucomicrobia bacterium]|nr:PPC domain-containing protein [Verrucomicrobiota bacterium]